MAEKHLLVAHDALDAAVHPEVNGHEFVADGPRRQGDVPFLFALAAQQAIEKFVRVVVRILPDLVDLVENEDRPLGIVRERLPDRGEDTVQPDGGAGFLAGHLEEDLVRGTEDRPTLFQVHVFDRNIVGPRGELRTDPACRHRLAGPGRAVDGDGRREIALMNSVQDARKVPFLLVARDDFVRWCQ